jgi:hypothetical protein
MIRSSKPREIMTPSISMYSPYKLIVAGRAAIRSLAAGPAPGEEQILVSLELRTKQILPEGFEVHRSDVALRLTGAGTSGGRTAIWTPTFAWRSTFPVDERLSMVFQSYAQQVQQFLARAQGYPWPAAGAKPHTSVTTELVSVWWGGAAEGDCVRRLQPIARSDLGV